MDKIDELLTRGVQDIFPSKKALGDVLRSGKKIRLYQGFDPSMPSLHLGNWVGIQKLRQFQELGHEVIFLVGDFTGMIGDPTDKSATRQMLTLDKTKANAATWKEQAGKILKFDGPNPAKILYNSDWLNKLNFSDVINLSSNFTVQQMIERDFFQKRIKEGKPIYLHEFLYPLVQGYDSVAMDVDLELGGNDQMFNLMAGRTLMAALKHKEKFCMTTKLLVDNSGNKAGKTSGNALFLTSDPNDIFGGIMSFNDEMIAPAFELLTSLPMEDTPKSGHPMELKKQLAHRIVTEIYSKDEADTAQNKFEDTFQKGEITDAAEVRAKTVDDLISNNIIDSKSEWKRLVKEGAVECDGVKIAETNSLKPGVYKIGKKRFVKVV